MQTDFSNSAVHPLGVDNPDYSYTRNTKGEGFPLKQPVPVSRCEPEPRGATRTSDPDAIGPYITTNSVHNNQVNSNSTVQTVNHSEASSHQSHVPTIPISDPNGEPFDAPFKAVVNVHDSANFKRPSTNKFHSDLQGIQ